MRGLEGTVAFFQFTADSYIDLCSKDYCVHPRNSPLIPIPSYTHIPKASVNSKGEGWYAKESCVIKESDNIKKGDSKL